MRGDEARELGELRVVGESPRAHEEPGLLQRPFAREARRVVGPVVVEALAAADVADARLGGRDALEAARDVDEIRHGETLHRHQC